MARVAAPKGKEERKTYEGMCFFRNSRRLRLASTLKTTIMDRNRKGESKVSIWSPLIYPHDTPLSLAAT